MKPDKMNLLALATLLPFALAGPLEPRLDNNLALTPPMGWNSYNHYSCSPNSSIILSNANALVSLGLSDLGYSYVTTDCGWTIPERTSNGTLTWNATLFPEGFPAMGEVIHVLGLSFGVYSDGGIQMCMTGGVNQTGSLHHETTDAQTFASWGADLLKYDNCYSSAARGYPDTDYAPLVSPESNYKVMLLALQSTHRPMLYQICDWGLDFPSAWAPNLGNTWRISNDILPAWRSIYRIVNQAAPQTDFAGPDHWLDLDMLEVGNGVLSYEEEKTHFSLWAVLKSPLVIGCALNDTLTSVSDESLAVLSNGNVIGFNQDVLGVAAGLKRRWSEEGLDLWAGPLSGNRTVAALVNWNNVSVDAVLDLPDLGLQSSGLVRDAWTNETRKDVQTSYAATIAPHGTLLLELQETVPKGKYILGGRTGVIHLSDVYGLTTSSSYNLEAHFSEFLSCGSSFEVKTSGANGSTPSNVSTNGQTVNVPVTLAAGNNNTVTIISSLPVNYVVITPPSGEFYPSTAFAVSGTAAYQNCTVGLCQPVGSKITNLTQDGTATLQIPQQPAGDSPRYVDITYINNEVAFDTSWTDGRNARNITISVNGAEATRLEVPLSGRSSELYSPMRGWGDPATLGVLIGGWGTGTNGTDSIVISNVGGASGVQPYGADFVGLKIY